MIPFVNQPNLVTKKHSFKVLNKLVSPKEVVSGFGTPSTSPEKTQGRGQGLFTGATYLESEHTLDIDTAPPGCPNISIKQKLIS